MLASGAKLTVIVALTMRLRSVSPDESYRPARRVDAEGARCSSLVGGR